MKFRSAFASQLENSLPGNSVLTPETASNSSISSFMGRHAVHAVRPLHAGIVNAKRRRKVSAALLAQEVRTRFAARARRASGTFLPPDLSRTYVLNVDDSVTIASVVKALQADANVEYAEPEKVYSTNSNPNDPYLSSSGSWGQTYDDLWGIKAVAAPTAWQTAAGSGVVVAVVDTGVDYNHSDLACNIWTNSAEAAGNSRDDDGNGYIDDIRGWNFVNNTNDVTDDHGHGTHVAGTIAGCGNNGIGVIGVAWQAKIMPLKALNSAGSGYDSDLARAIVYAADNGADIISNSWGAVGSSQTITDAIAYAYNMGAVIVAAAGNDGGDARNFSPANLNQVITVAATTPSGTLALFSNYGPKIDVSAPGVDILSLRANSTSMGTAVGTDYTRASGTSMAAPHVSGVAALVLSQNPTYTNEQVRAVLRGSATDLGTSGFDLTYGYGRVNAAAALTVNGPLEAKIQALQYGSNPLDPIGVSGIARGTGFVRYTLEYGSGTQPTSWSLFQTGLAPVTGSLGQFDPSLVSNGVYTIRLTVFNASGLGFIDEAQVSVNTLVILGPVPPRVTSSATTYKPGKLIPVTGTAVASGFKSFQLQWATGVNPASGWKTTGITLTGGGLSPLTNAQLGIWDTSSITQAGYYTIRLTATGTWTTSTSTLVYLEPDLVSTNWPVWLDQGPYFNSSVIPVSSPDGTNRFALSSENNGSIPGALWMLGLDGTAQKTPLPSYGSFHQPSVAQLTDVSGQEIVVVDNGVVRIFDQINAPAQFTPFATIDLMKHPLVVENLGGDSKYQTIAIGNNYASHTADLYAWQPDGSLFSSKFPIHVADKNDLWSWYNHVRLLVGDFRGDGQKEIVAQEGLSSTTYTLRIFASDGTPQTWNVPVLTGIPFAMIAADLDHNGKLETILVSYSGTQVTVHVFQPDGSERSGWPYQFVASNQYSQAFLAVGDLNRDGQDEIVFSHETEMYLFKPNGTLFSTSWPLRTSTMGYGAVVIGDVDGDGQAEIVTTRNDTSAGYYNPKLLALRSDGTISRSWQLTGMNGYDAYAYPMPVIGDFDQNGTTDIAVAYTVTGPGGTIPGVVTLINTGARFDVAGNDWPYLLHDVRNTGVQARKLSPAVTLVSSDNPSVVDQQITLAVTVSSAGTLTPTGVVTITDSGAPVGSCTLSAGNCSITATLTTGSHTLLASYAGDVKYLAATSAALTQLVNKGSSSVTVTCPESLPYNGSEINPCTAAAIGAGLNQVLGVTYTNNVNAGTATASATFAGDEKHAASNGSATFAITKLTPVITWATPSAITYGTALSNTQLNATSITTGSLSYEPPLGTVLHGGLQLLKATFVPVDTTNYNTIQSTVQLQVIKAIPTLTWASPSAIAYGTALTSKQLNASAGNLTGSFVYSPAIGSVLQPGVQTLAVTFTPDNTTDFTTAIASVSLTVTPSGTAASPVFSPAFGRFTSPQSIAIQDSMPGVTIYYTTDGSTPTTSSSVYRGPVAISKSATLNAFAVGNGYGPSQVSTASYTVAAAQPTFSPAFGTFSSAQTVTILDITPGVMIYYTTDGTIPTTSSPNQCSSPCTLTVSKPQAINAIAAGGNYDVSAAASASYVFATAAPVITPGFGTFTAPQQVKITDVTAGATIYYTIDSSIPTTAPANRCASPCTLTVSTSGTVKAIAALANYSPSTVVSASYVFATPTPVITPGFGTFTGPQQVKITDAAPGATIYYTNDGTIPTTASPNQCSSPCTLNVSTAGTVKAIAVLANYSPSTVVSASYVFATPTPVITPGFGTFTGPQQVKITDSMPGATIYYTTDGTLPTTASPNQCSSPCTLNVSTSGTVKAIAIGGSYSASAVASASYVVR